RVAVLDLRPPCKTGTNEMAQVVERKLLAQLTHVKGLLRSGTHNSQLSSQDIHHLRQLIEMRPAEDPAERGNPRVVLTGPLATWIGDGPRGHGSELEDRE